MRDFVEMVIAPVVLGTLITLVLIPPVIIMLVWWLSVCLEWAHKLGLL